MEAVRSAVRRIFRAWRGLAGEQRMAAIAALALIATMFLPWYEKSTIPRGGREFVHDTISAFGAVSFVEAAVFLVAAGVLVLLFLRAEGRAFHLPGGDGTVIFAAGLWATLLIFWRVFDRPDVAGGGRGSTVGIQWGFFLAFVAAGFLAYAGARLRAAHRPEPPLPVPSEEPPPATAPTVRRRRTSTADDENRQMPGQMTFDEAETHRLRE
jgi:hypothetical protein